MMMKNQPNMAWRPFHRSALVDTPQPYELKTGKSLANVSVAMGMNPPGCSPGVLLTTVFGALTLDAGATKAYKRREKRGKRVHRGGEAAERPGPRTHTTSGGRAIDDRWGGRPAGRTRTEAAVRHRAGTRSLTILQHDLGHGAGLQSGSS